MRALKETALALLGLFVDDGSLAISVLMILILTALVASTPWIHHMIVGVAFAGAILVAFLENVIRSALTRGPTNAPPVNPERLP